MIGERDGILDGGEADMHGVGCRPCDVATVVCGGQPQLVEGVEPLALVEDLGLGQRHSHADIDRLHAAPGTTCSFS